MSLTGRWLDRLQSKAALIWSVATDRRLPWRARAPAALALAYVASPIDLVPDFLPGGWLDDLLVLLLAAAVTPLLVPRRLVAEHAGAAAPRPLAEDALGGSQLAALSWLLIVVGAMLALAALIAAGSDLGFGEAVAG